VIVGSSRGGAVAVNMQSKDTPLVLLCPAWKNWGTAATVKQNTIILHLQTDLEGTVSDDDNSIS